MKIKFLEYINEQKSNKIIAYHGSPYKFTKFDYKKQGKSGQIGADLGFWFTTDKKVAINFAMVYPDEMYDKFTKIREEKNREKNIELDKLIKKLDFTEIINFLKESDYDTAARNIELYLKEKNYEKLKSHLFAMVQFLGKRNIPKSVYDNTDNILFIDDKYNKEIEEEENKIREYYNTQHKGYLYTVELNLGKHGVENGEDIGTNWGRFGVISEYEDEGYDSLLIKFADTGQGLADEIVIFNNKNIKIIKIEEV
jgi:hypothetical protein